LSQSGGLEGLPGSADKGRQYDGEAIMTGLALACREVMIAAAKILSVTLLAAMRSAYCALRPNVNDESLTLAYSTGATGCDDRDFGPSGRQP
jgi:hypothetical protein